MENILAISFLAAGGLFILSLSGLGKQETASRGNMLGIIGILIAIGATALSMSSGVYLPLVVAMTIGAGIGAAVAARVQMTAMPELVAILHSFVGLAAVFVGIGGHIDPVSNLSGAEAVVHEIEIFLGVFIGAITFTGSIVAFLKLRGSISGKPMMLPGRHMLNLGMVVGCVLLGMLFVGDAGATFALLLMTIIAGVIGVHMVLAIGGADMPVVVSMLNSYSGWAAAATGFMLANDLLIITGALVGSSGAILSYVMCRGMNRSFISVIAGGFGTDGGGAAPAAAGDAADVVATDAADVADLLSQSEEVIVVPGYGLAVAQAQHPMWEVTRKLQQAGVRVRFAIHPVAGRLPGHMNVLLAEANVPYDIVEEMEEINEDFPKTNVVLVVGANDIVNPGAQDDPSSPIYGMPVLEAWLAKHVIVLKRSMGTGYSGVGNPLFFKENTKMLFGDAKASIDGILDSLKG